MLTFQLSGDVGSLPSDPSSEIGVVEEVKKATDEIGQSESRISSLLQIMTSNLDRMGNRIDSTRKSQVETRPAPLVTSTDACRRKFLPVFS